METLLQKLVKKLVCISCSVHVKPPLKRCFMGHFCCEKCAESLCGKCSTECQLEMGAMRDYLLEKVCFGITVKCSFSPAGCHFAKVGILVAEHEKNCKFFRNEYSSIGSDDISLNKYSEDTSRQHGKQINTETYLGMSESESHDVQGQSVQSVDEAILAELECPVCLVRISPPICECVNGHRICGRCSARLDKCPVCRCPNSNSTNIIIEDIYIMLHMPCKNLENGCAFYGMGDSVLEHEKSCGFVQGSCPLTWVGICTWQGLMPEVANHCEKTHPVILSLKQQRSFSEVMPVDVVSCYNYFYVCQTLFRCGWQKRGSAIRFTVNYMGERNCADRFGYVMKLIKPGSKSEKIFPGRWCAHIDDQSYAQRHSSTRLTSEQMMEYLDDQHILNYNVQIINNNG